MSFYESLNIMRRAGSGRAIKARDKEGRTITIDPKTLDDAGVQWIRENVPPEEIEGAIVARPVRFKTKTGRSGTLHTNVSADQDLAHIKDVAEPQEYARVYREVKGTPPPEIAGAIPYKGLEYLQRAAMRGPETAVVGGQSREIAMDPMSGVMGKEVMPEVQPKIDPMTEAVIKKAGRGARFVLDFTVKAAEETRVAGALGMPEFVSSRAGIPRYRNLMEMLSGEQPDTVIPSFQQAIQDFSSGEQDHLQTALDVAIDTGNPAMIALSLPLTFMIPIGPSVGAVKQAVNARKTATAYKILSNGITAADAAKAGVRWPIIQEIMRLEEIGVTQRAAQTAFEAAGARTPAELERVIDDIMDRYITPLAKRQSESGEHWLRGSLVEVIPDNVSSPLRGVMNHLTDDLAENITKMHGGADASAEAVASIWSIPMGAADWAVGQVSSKAWKPILKGTEYAWGFVLKRKLDWGLERGLYDTAAAARQKFITDWIDTETKTGLFLRTTVAPSDRVPKILPSVHRGAKLAHEDLKREVLLPLFHKIENEEMAMRVFDSVDGRLPYEELTDLERHLHDSFVTIRDKLTQEALNELVLDPHHLNPNYIRHYYDKYANPSLVERLKRGDGIRLSPQGYKQRRMPVMEHEDAANIQAYSNVINKLSARYKADTEAARTMQQRIVEALSFDMHQHGKLLPETRDKVIAWMMEDRGVPRFTIPSSNMGRRVAPADKQIYAESKNTYDRVAQQFAKEPFQPLTEKQMQIYERAAKEGKPFYKKGEYITQDYKDRYLIRDVRAGLEGLSELGYDTIMSRHMVAMFNDPDVNSVAKVWDELLGGRVELNPQTYSKYASKKELGRLQNQLRSATDDNVIAALKRDIAAREAIQEQIKRLKDDPRGRYVKVPDKPEYGPMRGVYVRRSIMDDMKVTQAAPEMGARITEVIFGGQKYLYRQWKASKTILNPATHARNMMWNAYSTFMLADVNPLDFRVWRGATKGLLNKDSELYKTMQAAKIFGSGFTAELNTAASREFASRMMSSLAGESTQKGGSGWSAMLKAAGTKVRKAPAQIYAGEESFSKALIIESEIQRAGGWGKAMAAARRGDMSFIDDAVDKAQKFLFDYGDKSPLLEFFTSQPIVGSPFATFYAKFFPVFAEQLAKRPHRALVPFALAGGGTYAGYKKYGKETMERAQGALPPWVDITLPIGGDRDDPDSIRFWDMTNIWPYMDTVSMPKGSFQEIAEWTESSQNPFGLFNAPVSKTMIELGKNSDFRGFEIYSKNLSPDSAYVRQQVWNHIWRTLIPSLMPSIETPALPQIVPFLGEVEPFSSAGYGARRLAAAWEGKEDPGTGLERSKTEAVLKALGGIDITRVNVEKQDVRGVRDRQKEFNDIKRAMYYLERRKGSIPNKEYESEWRSLERTLSDFQKGSEQ